MRKIVILLSLLMITSGLSGCIGDSQVETMDGDEVILELSDDWPTYYVPTSNDLPTCDSTTQGRLYYVEADTNFQACTSTGWQVVEIGGSNANVILNSAPIVTANLSAQTMMLWLMMATELIRDLSICHGLQWIWMVLSFQLVWTMIPTE